MQQSQDEAAGASSLPRAAGSYRYWTWPVPTVFLFNTTVPLWGAAAVGGARSEDRAGESGPKPLLLTGHVTNQPPVAEPRGIIIILLSQPRLIFVFNTASYRIRVRLYSGYPPGMVPGTRKCRITRHSVSVLNPGCGVPRRARATRVRERRGGRAHDPRPLGTREYGHARAWRAHRLYVGRVQIASSPRNRDNKHKEETRRSIINIKNPF